MSSAVLDTLYELLARKFWDKNFCDHHKIYDSINFDHRYLEMYAMLNYDHD